ncbi:MAG: hypothetical protein JRG76_14460 [Deltaproteobacteria bacterium]|nr:hypothetical protein [Deltaproteobacteria bacterium]
MGPDLHEVQVPGSEWRAVDFSARVSAPRQRYPAGSPTGREIEAYRSELDASLRRSGVDRALVFGMTPELRNLVLESGASLVSVDRCEAAVTAYADWVPTGASERIVRAEWTSVDAQDLGVFGAVLGDGVFPNLLSVGLQRDLLRRVQGLLAPGARAIFRQPLLPEDEALQTMSLEKLVGACRRHEMGRSAFGLTARLWGFASKPGVLEDGLLDNALVFELVDKGFARGEIREAEYRAIQCFSYLGKNLFLSEAEWRSLAGSVGFSCRRRELSGELWYQYFPFCVLESLDAG